MSREVEEQLFALERGGKGRLWNGNWNKFRRWGGVGGWPALRLCKNEGVEVGGGEAATFFHVRDVSSLVCLL